MQKQVNKRDRINYSLETLNKVLPHLGNPQNAFQSIHVAGTNGKGSVCSFLELLYLEILPELKIGKYTSPHLVSECERISVNGADISEADLEKLNSYTYKTITGEEIDLTYFEMMTLAAFRYFKEQQVDIAIIETGMGGRWDATNTLSPEHSLATAITSIGMDHMEYLGDSLESILAEKLAIKKNNVPHFGINCLEDIQELKSINPNAIDGENFLLALEIFESINRLKVSEEAKEQVLAKFPQRYRARFQHIPEKNLILDSAHNPQAMSQLNKFIKLLDYQGPKIFILGFLDKDFRSSIDNLFKDLIQEEDLVICTEPDSQRKTESEAIAQYIKSNYNSKLEITKKPKDIHTDSSKLNIVCGSVYLLGEFNC